MAPVDFSSQQAFVCFVHPAALEADAYKGAAVWPVNQWQAAEPSLQMGNTWQPMAWPCVQQGSYAGNMWPVQTMVYAEPMQPQAYALQDTEVHPQALSTHGEVWRLATSKQGCRQLQDALEDAASDEERIALAAGLCGHVWEATRCPNANHVIQKCIDTMRPLDLQFIIDEISGSAALVARHRYGVRVLQRLLEHCSPAQVQGLVVECLADAVVLCSHIYANYFMAHIVEHGAESHRLALMMLLAENAAAVCHTTYGCSVMTKALELAPSDAKTSLANAVLLESHMLAGMAALRHGHLTVKLALQAADEDQRQQAVKALAAQQGMLSKSRYGRTLSRYVQESFPQE